MLAAKLFGALSILVAFLALVSSARSSLSIDIYVHSTYIVLSPRIPLLLIAVLSAVFALVYVAVARWSPRKLNGFLSLLHFVVTVVGVLLVAVAITNVGDMSIKPGAAYVATARMEGDAVFSLWPSHALEVGVLTLIIGGFVFVANLAVTMAKLLRFKLGSL
jgi:heme/copper-type cytochrome/quinol oxidase subunit 1